MVKSFLSRQVGLGNDSLMNAKDIVKALNDSHLAKEITPTSPLERKFTLLENVRRPLGSDRLDTVVGSSKIHSFYFDKDTSLHTRNLSCFCHPCISRNFTECENKDLIDNFEERHVFYPSTEH